MLNLLATASILLIALLGLVAGVVGGLAGVGGSLVMIPGLHFIHGDEPATLHHLYMAAAMVVNVAVAFPAARQHARAGAVRRDLVRPILAAAVLGIVSGVMISNRIDGQRLKIGLSAFIGLYCLYLGGKLLRRVKEPDSGDRPVKLEKLLVSGGLSGLVGGLLGLGGGVVLVPLLQVFCGVRLRHAIGTSSAVICVTAIIGAGLKLGTLNDHGQSIPQALVLAGLMAPTAIIGARLGARLTHRLPLQWVRGVIVALMALAAARLAGLW